MVQPEASVALSNLSLFLLQIMEDSAPRARRSMFACLVGASQLLGLASVVLTGVWMGHYRGGFAWDGSAREFNLHPLCMVLGLVFLQGDGEFTLISHSRRKPQTGLIPVIGLCRSRSHQVHQRMLHLCGTLIPI